LFDRLRRIGENVLDISGQLSGVYSGVKADMGENILVHCQVLKWSRVVADRTYPLWPLFLELKVGSGIEALDVTAFQAADRHD
jgi:hypothetical protein